MPGKDIEKDYPDVWAEVKHKCKLNTETLQMAKEMGINPKSLMKNIPNKNQKWKAPVSAWIKDMYEKSMEKSTKKKHGEKEILY